MNNKVVKIYEVFHKSTQSQNRVISENNFTYRHILETINKYLNAHQKILDIGCGAGTVSLYLLSKDYSVLGIDISKKAISAATRSAEYLNFKNARFIQMNFPSQSPLEKFDFIICTEVIEHIEDDELVFRKIFSLLKKNGIAFISTPSKNAPLYRLGLADKFDREVGHLRRYTISDLKNKTKQNGFIILETKKTEGIIRNFLFLNPIAGKFIKLVKFFISDWITYLDNISLKTFGESNIFIVIQKP